MNRLLALALLPTATALASAGPPPAEPTPAGPAVFGEARLEDVTLDVTCTGTTAPLRCALHATFTLVAVGEVRLERGLRTTLTVAGAPLSVDGRTVAAGERVDVELTQTRVLAVHEAWRDTFWLIPAMLARHPLLGESEGIEHRGDTLLASLATGSQLAITGPIHVDARGAGLAVVRVGGERVRGVEDVTTTSPTVEVTLDQPGMPGGRAVTPHTIVRRGGPVLALGARFDLAVPNDEGRFFLAAGYEVGITEWAFASAAFETNFESIMQSVVVEAALPELMIVVPSLGAGIGIVARELGPHDAAAALRLRAEMGFVGVGVVADFDYWPETRTWTGTVAVRGSI